MFGLRQSLNLSIFECIDLCISTCQCANLPVQFTIIFIRCLQMYSNRVRLVAIFFGILSDI